MLIQGVNKTYAQWEHLGDCLSGGVPIAHNELRCNPDKEKLVFLKNV